MDCDQLVDILLAVFAFWWVQNISFSFGESQLPVQWLGAEQDWRLKWERQGPGRSTRSSEASDGEQEYNLDKLGLGPGSGFSCVATVKARGLGCWNCSCCYVSTIFAYAGGLCTRPPALFRVRLELSPTRIPTTIPCPSCESSRSDWAVTSARRPGAGPCCVAAAWARQLGCRAY